MDNPELEERLIRMGKAIPYEGTEIGETWGLLIDIFERIQEDYVSPEFAEGFKKELIKQLEDFENNYEFTEEEREVTRKETTRYLNYKG